MRKELDDKLCLTYSGLYRGRNGTAMQTCMHWGFSHGDGWYSIIDVLSELLIAHNPKIIADQVKEKFGSLRFYFSGHSDYAGGLVGMAEQISSVTCEECGAPADMCKEQGWVETKCTKHRRGNSGGEKVGIEVYSHPRIGLGWARLVTILQGTCDFHVKHNGAVSVTIKATKKRGELWVTFIGGNDQTAGMVDFVNRYATRIDEHTGKIVHY